MYEIMTSVFKTRRLDHYIGNIRILSDLKIILSLKVQFPRQNFSNYYCRWTTSYQILFLYTMVSLVSMCRTAHSNEVTSLPLLCGFRFDEMVTLSNSFMKRKKKQTNKQIVYILQFCYIS